MNRETCRDAVGLMVARVVAGVRAADAASAKNASCLGREFAGEDDIDDVDDIDVVSESDSKHTLRAETWEYVFSAPGKSRSVARPSMVMADDLQAGVIWRKSKTLVYSRRDSQIGLDGLTNVG